MTVAEEYAARLSGSVMLPVAKIKAVVKVPKSRELARAGLLPLRLTTLSVEEMEDEEHRDEIEAAARATKRLVCECSLVPRIVDHEPKTKDQIKFDDIHDKDVSALYNKIMELASNAYFNAEPATESKSQLGSLSLIAVHAKKWNLDPTVVADWEPARFDELMMFSELLEAAIKKAQGEDG